MVRSKNVRPRETFYSLGCLKPIHIWIVNFSKQTPEDIEFVVSNFVRTEEHKKSATPFSKRHFWAKCTFSLQKNNEMKCDINFISVLL